MSNTDESTNLSGVKPGYILELSFNNPFSKYYKLIEVHKDGFLYDFIRYNLRSSEFKKDERSRLSPEEFELLIGEARRQFALK